MTHEHYDLSEVESVFRAMRERARSRVHEQLSGFSTETWHAADSVFEATLQIMMLTPRLRNEGRDDDFIAQVYATLIANLMVNAIGASGDPDATLAIIDRRVNRMVKALSGDVPDGAVLLHGQVVGARGGRA